jgi:hypothetical protein
MSVSLGRLSGDDVDMLKGSFADLFVKENRCLPVRGGAAGIVRLVDQSKMRMYDG